MGGDHRCPVCQATFTRPQHVARHMRSHTGDRPYKCQYCGDQFARSDLLARHINKCHANEKPLPNTVTGTRRKGSAAASRATTSKQACDQCVQSSLPCDGSNPCSKCLARKCRCTYVKFHRQTAPTGPGHNPPQSPSSSLASNVGLSRFPPQLDGFMLAPPPPAPPVTSVAFTTSDQIFNTPFTFNPAAPPYPLNWTASDLSQLSVSVASEPDMTAKYRAQTDFIRRSGHATLPTSSPTMLQAPYCTQQQPPSSNWYPTWGESGTYHPLDDTKQFDSIERAHSFASSEPPSYAPELYGPDLIGSAYRPRRMSLDFSDSSSATSQSVPSSATSSNVHLPLPENDICEGRSEEMHPHNADDWQPHRTASLPSFLGPAGCLPPLTQQPPRPGEGGFSSAFGLMSIDDANALAHLSSDGAPFFSTLGMGVLPNSPNATPMPARVPHAHPHQGRDRVMSLGGLPTTPGPKEPVEPRELKDMFKTFLRSPLGGSGTATLDAPTSHVPPLPSMPQSPSGQRRRMRVSSLPSVTPTVEKGHPMMGGLGECANGSTVQATLHGNQDLRSYEAAVNARSASLKLNLVPRRKGVRPNGSSPGGVDVSAAVQCPADQDIGISRPSSSSSTSSLAQAFTLSQRPHPQNHAHNHANHAHAHASVKSPPLQAASISLPIPPMSGLHSVPYAHAHHPPSVALSTSLTFEPGSRASSVTSDGTGTGGSGSDSEAFRPSFKRYPSQTLVSATSKRALVERGGGEPKGVKVDSVDSERVEEEGRGEARARARARRPERGRVESGAGSPRSSRLIAALPERAKRL